jgi:hypothetical protein
MYDSLNLENQNSPIPAPVCGGFCDSNSFNLTANTQRADSLPGSDRAEDCWGATDIDLGLSSVAEFDGEDDCDGDDKPVPDTDFPPVKIAPGWEGHIDILSPAWICPCDDIIPFDDQNNLDGCEPVIGTADVKLECECEPPADLSSADGALSDEEFAEVLQNWADVAIELDGLECGEPIEPSDCRPFGATGDVTYLD